MSTTAAIWKTTRHAIDLSRPQVMGIVNVTPDSFSDGVSRVDTRLALAHAEQLIKEGAQLLDIGGESTRPGAQPVRLVDELDRVLPVVRAALSLGVPISVDTYKPEVMQACLDLGVDIINDVWALQRPFSEGQGDGVDVVARHPSCGVCLMHMHLEPRNMQIAPMAGDVVPKVAAFLADKAQQLRDRGVEAARIVLDCGIGFGKTVEQNFSLLARQAEVLALGYPLLAGWSRKSSLGRVTGRELARERVAASVAAALLAVERGARIVRVHDVRETVDAIKVWEAMAAQDR